MSISPSHPDRYSRWGRIGFVLAVGDVEPNRDEDDNRGIVGAARYRKVGDFPQVVGGEITLGAPLYFIAGNHDPYPALERVGPGEWAPGVWWLGRAGVISWSCPAFVDSFRFGGLEGSWGAPFVVGG